MFKKGIFFVTIIIFAVLAIGFVSASPDLNQTDSLNADLDDSEISLDADNDLDLKAACENDVVSIDEKSLDGKDSIKLSLDTSSNPKLAKSSSSKTFSDLQRYIDNAKKGSVVKISSKYVGTGKAIKIDKSITIKGTGKGATLDAKKLSRIFHIKGKVKVKLINVKLINALEKKSKGGAIYFGGSELVIDKCKFNNNAAYSAGDIYNAGGKCTVKRSSFKGSYDYDEDPEADLIDGYTCPFDYSSIITKGVSSFYRCAFKNIWSNAIFSSKKCSFNKCSFSGIDYSVMVLKGTNTVKNCKFTKNSGFREEIGGHYIYLNTIEIKKGKTTISKCSFIKNSDNVIDISRAATCKIIDSKFKYNFNTAVYMDEDTHSAHHATIWNHGTLEITKNKKTTTYNKGEVFGDNLKTSWDISPTKFKVPHNAKKTISIRYFGPYAVKKQPILKVFTGDKYKTFKGTKSRWGVFKFDIKGLSAGEHKFKLYIKLDQYTYDSKQVIRNGTIIAT